MRDFPLAAGDCEALLGDIRAGVVVSDASERVLWANARFCELVGAGAADVAGKPLAELIGQPAEQPADGIQRFRIGSGSTSLRWLECAAASHGERSLRIFTDVSAFTARGKNRTAVVWGLDPLRLDAETGVLNRRTILQELNAQISRSRRYGNALGVMELRIVTDPGAADHARQEVAECLKNTLRWADFIGTLSEDTFLIVLPETDAAAMAAVAEKIRETWENPQTPHTDAPVSLEFATTSWNDGDNLDAVLQRLIPATGTPASAG
ncbi:MAG: diguanylate cyclase [Gammaproteobacteria bacterium]|nr:diguanylate cyclase [Gammaproteobacteria bacterium]